MILQLLPLAEGFTLGFQSSSFGYAQLQLKKSNLRILFRRSMFYDEGKVKTVHQWVLGYFLFMWEVIGGP